MKNDSTFWKTFVLLFVLMGSGYAEDPKELVALKKDFEASPAKNTEAGREQYIVSLIHLWEKYKEVYESTGKKAGGSELRAVDLEIANRPALKDYNPSPSLLLGDWEGARHGTRYFADNNWIMLPAEDCTIHGKWKISKNEYFKNYSDWGDKFDSGYAIYLLNHDYFVSGGQKGVYIEKRVPHGTYGKDQPDLHQVPLLNLPKNDEKKDQISTNQVK